MKQKIISALILFFSLILIVAGIYRQEAECVLEKATKICLECIGIG